MVAELPASGFHVEAVYFTDRFPHAAAANGVKISAREMDQISPLTTPSPVLAVVHKPAPTPDLTALAKSRVLALDTIRDPGNLGTIIRTADWFGMAAVIASPDTVDVFNPKCVQATMGSIFRVPVHYAALDVLRELKTKNSAFTIYGAMLEGRPSSELRGAAGAGALLIGNESLGVSPEAQRLVDVALTIKGAGGAESLNASVSAAVLMYEWAAL